MNQKYIVALELSGSQVKGALAEVSLSNNGTMAIPTIDAIATEDNADCVQYGRVQNVVNAAKKTDMILKKLQDCRSLDGGTINGAYVALAGRSLSSEKTSAEIILPSEMVITNEILKNLFVEAAKKVSNNRQVLKVLPRKYVVDNQTMPSPVGALGRKLRGEFTLVTCNPTNQRNLDLVASNKENGSLTVIDYIVTPLAMADMVLDEESKQLGCVLVDIGYQTITISIYKDRALQYLSTLPIGSHNITRDISVGLNWTMEKAEKMKCTQGDATYEHTRGTDENSRMNAYVAARAYEIVANINANIDYANYKAVDLPRGITLVGRGSRLHNLENLLAAQCKMMVTYAKVPTNINFSNSSRGLRPEDYMSLIAIILKISRTLDFKNCVTPAPHPETLPIVETEAEKPNAINTPHEVPVNTETAKKKTVDANEESWQQDDPDPEEEDKPKKKVKETGKRGGLIDVLKRRWENLVTPPDIDDQEI